MLARSECKTGLRRTEIGDRPSWQRPLFSMEWNPTLRGVRKEKNWYVLVLNL